MSSGSTTESFMNTICTEKDRQGLEAFVDYAVSIAHVDETVFETNLFALICQIPIEFMDELLEMLEIFEEDLGVLFLYVRAFAFQREQDRALMH